MDKNCVIKIIENFDLFGSIKKKKLTNQRHHKMRKVDFVLTVPTLKPLFYHASLIFLISSFHILNKFFTVHALLVLYVL